MINSCICLFAFQSNNIKCAKQDPCSSLSVSTQGNTERKNNRRQAQQPCNQSHAGNPEGNFGSFDQVCHGQDTCHHNSSPCHVGDIGMYSREISFAHLDLAKALHSCFGCEPSERLFFLFHCVCFFFVHCVFVCLFFVCVLLLLFFWGGHSKSRVQ